jgi:hypothetical protein
MRRCVDCKWYKLTESEVYGKPDQGGWCARFPVWETLPDNHYCGEFDCRETAKSRNEYYEK